MILFRVDSSFTIGTGHIARCLHLAKLLKNQNFSVVFLCRDLPGNIMSQISSQGFKAYSLTENEDDIKKITELKPDWVIVDHYQLGEEWEKQLPSSTKIFVIDDLINRQHHCHVLLDQNYRRDFSKYRELVPAQTRLLLGPQYCLMPENLKKSSAAKTMSSDPKVLAFFGGSDATGELVKLAEALIAQGFKYKINFVALQSHRHLEKLKSIEMPGNFSLLIDPPNWHHLISESDFYIGSGGTVTWERFFLGLPGAVIAVAENQEAIAEQLGEDGYQFYWGTHKNFDYQQIAQKISEALSDSETLNRFSEKGLSLVNKLDADLVSKIFKAEN